MIFASFLDIRGSDLPCASKSVPLTVYQSNSLDCNVVETVRCAPVQRLTTLSSKQDHLPQQVKQVSCHICHKIFANIYRLQRHMLSHELDPQTRKFRCSQCSKAFKFKHHLKVSFVTRKHALTEPLSTPTMFLGARPYPYG